MTVSPEQDRTTTAHDLRDFLLMICGIVTAALVWTAAWVYAPSVWALVEMARGR